MFDKNPLVYIIEDEESIARLISLYLEKSSISSKIFPNAEVALEYIQNETKPDLIILDLNLPGMSGFDFLNKMNTIFNSKMPSTMILSARDQDEDIIQGLGFGAEEFITKPFSPSVLVARVQANLRRQSNATANAEESITFGEYTLLVNSCVLKKGTVKIPLSTKEYKVLEYLVKNAGVTLSPENIYQSVWKVQYGDITAVAVYIQRLRKKIEKDISNCEYIKTDFGKGYIFNKDLIQS